MIIVIRHAPNFSFWSAPPWSILIGIQRLWDGLAWNFLGFRNIPWRSRSYNKMLFGTMQYLGTSQHFANAKWKQGAKKNSQYMRWDAEEFAPSKAKKECSVPVERNRAKAKLCWHHNFLILKIRVLLVNTLAELQFQCPRVLGLPQPLLMLKYRYSLEQPRHFDVHVCSSGA